MGRDPRQDLVHKPLLCFEIGINCVDSRGWHGECYPILLKSSSSGNAQRIRPMRKQFKPGSPSLAWTLQNRNLDDFFARASSRWDERAPLKAGHTFRSYDFAALGVSHCRLFGQQSATEEAFGTRFAFPNRSFAMDLGRLLASRQWSGTLIARAALSPEDV
jgi:hypothetical protein